MRGAGGGRAKKMGCGYGCYTKDSDTMRNRECDGILLAEMCNPTLLPSAPWLARKRRWRLAATSHTGSHWLEIRWPKLGQ